jgi:hypothetical protein
MFPETLVSNYMYLPSIPDFVSCRGLEISCRDTLGRGPFQ